MRFNMCAIIIASIVLSLLPSAYAALIPANCFDHYHYGQLEFQEFRPDKVQYDAGEAARVDFLLNNTLPVPIAGGSIKIMVVYRGEKEQDSELGDEIANEFFLPEEINLLPGESYTGSFRWAIPKGSKAGVYAINAYLMQSRAINLMGLAFTTSTPGATKSFTVKNPAGVITGIDKTTVKINSDSYAERMFTPFFSQSGKITITGTMAADADSVEKEVYSWDDNRKENLLPTFSQNLMNLKKGQQVGTELENLKPGVYLVRWVASKGDVKSIQYVRFAVSGSQPRIVSTGLDSFPVMKGQLAVLHVCATNAPSSISENAASDSVLIVEAKDKEGNVLFSDQIPASVDSQVSGFTGNFTAPEDISALTVTASVLANGTLYDEVKVPYDISRFSSGSFILELSQEPSEGKLAFSVSIIHSSGLESRGHLFVYLIDPEGKIASLQELDVKGRAQGSFGTANMKGGAYVLRAVDQDKGLKKEVLVRLPLPAANGGQPQALWIALAAAVAVAGLVLYAYRRRKA